MPALPTTESVTHTSSSTEQSGAQQIAVLMDQMRTKDTLVEQLTERLEAAAEQLDRIQRSGADRGRPGSGGGGSRELAEQAGQLTSKVEEALESWGQSSSHFEVIMQRLNEISDYISHPSEGQESKPASKPAAGLFQAPAAGASSAPAASASQVKSTAGSGAGPGSFWEKMKASMVDGTPAPALPTAKAAPPSVSNSGAPEQPAEEHADPLESIAPPPTMIDIDNASIEELREAVDSRDNYISTLITELRLAHTLPQLPEDFVNSGLGPADLLARLVDLETRLTSGIQRENLELSLERARMGRERVRLDQVKAQLEGQIKRLATSAVEKTDDTQSSAKPAPPTIAEGKLSWLKRLQPKKPME